MDNNHGFVTRSSQFDSEWEHHFKEIIMFNIFVQLAAAKYGEYNESFKKTSSC